ncbi:MAG TPA: tetratricopeptide repeat protein [Bacteroidales bacterium]|nr:tetratricopeptide repeat protein [Bacteroidales bacterium]
MHSRKIDKYLSGEMNQEDIDRFDLELKLNEQLLHEYKLSIELDKMIAEDEELLEFRKQIQEVHEQKSKTLGWKIVQSDFYRYWRLAAASVVIILMLSGMLYLAIPRHYSNEKLFSMYYNTEDVLSVTRSADNQLLKAMLKYQHKEFDEAAMLFDAILQEDENNTVIRFYKGVAYIETRRYNDAIKEFLKITSEEDHLFTEHANWFLGLTYLRNNETENAIVIFRDIMNDADNYYRSQAFEIHEKLINRN